MFNSLTKHQKELVKKTTVKKFLDKHHLQPKLQIVINYMESLKCPVFPRDNQSSHLKLLEVTESHKKYEWMVELLKMYCISDLKFDYSSYEISITHNIHCYVIHCVIQIDLTKYNSMLNHNNNYL